MASARKFYISKSVKNRRLLPSEKFGNILAFDKKSERKLLSLISADSFITNNLFIYIYNFRDETFFMPN